ncbi:DNA mismatch repair protein MutS [Dolosigranulum pigrum]|uniref:DNA mismatch repair protein MutS n=1 Tax=Dolosigranulum pigrum TaxID=29394 RepID=UPI001AD8761A|nr:DNA mismatch repair protein MutS [Dolosigranulum pigrum]QTJ53099.1 DNA mismatch repair protein MutS [Dolosigranulum pigrum]
MARDKAKHTPMMQQYLTMKENHPDAFLFFRLGDFYELFFEDAKEVAQLLELTLTSRNKKAEVEVPMCGVPHHSAQGYINQLVEMGYKVAVCEQVEDPKEAKGMVKREVVQVITPGTVMEGSAIEAKENTFVAAMVEQAHRYGLAYADLSTGELRVTFTDKESDLITEIETLAVKEVVKQELTLTELADMLAKRFDLTISEVAELHVHAEFDELKVDVPEGPLTTALDVLLHYLAQTQMRQLDHLQQAEVYEMDHFLVYGKEARRNLELTTSLRDGTKEGTLLWLLDETKTAMGGRMLKSWLDKPLIHVDGIQERHLLIDSLMHYFLERSDLIAVLKEVYDLERLAGRVAYGSVNARDLIQLKQSLQMIPHLREMLQLMNDEGVWDQVLAQLDPVVEVADLIERAIQEEPPLSVTEGEIINFGFDEQLDKYLSAMSNGKQWIADLQAQEREQTGIKNLKVGFNKVFGYYIEVTKSHIEKVDLDRYERKQTLANSERYITPELKEKESLILEAEEKSQALEYELFIQVREEVKGYIKRIQSLAKAVAKVDVLQSFAEVSETYNYVKPTYHTDSQDIVIESGRHPVVEKVMNDQSYVPNDIEMTNETDILLITGPNMSGKSTYMRQLALIVIMGQMGCFVPANHASLPLFDQIFTRIGAMDDLFGGQSTFMVEMNETNHAIQNATSRSLLLFDEIGRGTATYDGMALAEAIIEYVHDRIGAKTLFSTHYHELTELSTRLDKLENIHVGAVEERGSLVFLHKIKPGPGDKSYGVQVAQLAGLPEDLLDRASMILKDLEQTKGATISQTSDEAVITVEESTEQLALFKAENTKSPAEQAVIEQLQAINLTETTPLDAFDTIRELVKQLEKGAD